jgi:hypothetical protein
MEIGSRRETLSDRLDPFWIGSADNLVPTKTADFALGARGIPRSRRTLAAVGTTGGQLVRKSRREHRAPPENAGRARWVAYTKEGDPSWIRTVPRHFDVNRGMTRTCIESRSISGGSARVGPCRVYPPRTVPSTHFPRRRGNQVATAERALSGDSGRSRDILF